MKSLSATMAARFVLLGLVLPAILSFFVYYGFASNYTLRNVYSEAGFREQYENGVFRYRVLGRAAVLATYDLLTRNQLPVMGPKALHLVDPSANDALYTACFAVNTLFICLTCSALFFVVERVCGRGQEWLKDVSLLLMMCLMALTQYVVVPYDMMSYFFLAVAMLATVRDRLSIGWVATMCGALVLCTLTRETALLVLAFYAAIHRRQLVERPVGWRFNRSQKIFALLVACFVVTTALLRAYYGTDHPFYQQILFPNQFRFPPDVIGTVFFAALLAVLLMSDAGRADSAAFLLAASPYILAIFMFASPWETRLFCPVFLGMIVLKLRAIGGQVPVVPAI